MPACPMCSKPLRELTRKCPSCQADLDLLVDYASFLSGGLERAENLVRAGELGKAMWAYLEVLEVDPDNPAARRQVGQLVTAIRQFDQASLVNRMASPSANGAARKSAIDPQTFRALLLGGIMALLFAIGVVVGFTLASGSRSSDAPPARDKPAPQLGG